jgi:hypothetical protein
MAIDLSALKAKLAAKAVTPAPPVQAVTEAQSNNTSAQESPVTSSPTGGILSPEVMEASLVSTKISTENLPFDHMEFLGKMNELRDRIHTQHPQMPQLLKTIHTQLSKDPECVTLLSEEAIGVIVRGLQVQTKTELVTATVKKASASKTAKVKLSEDMF